MLELAELSAVFATLRLVIVSAFLADISARFLKSEVDDEAADVCPAVALVRECVLQYSSSKRTVAATRMTRDCTTDVVLCLALILLSVM